jgi:hypothetical protein
MDAVGDRATRCGGTREVPEGCETRLDLTTPVSSSLVLAPCRGDVAEFGLRDIRGRASSEVTGDHVTPGGRGPNRRFCRFETVGSAIRHLAQALQNPLRSLFPCREH